MATGNNAHPLTLLQFPFAAGIDEGTRDELVEPGAGWPVLENGRQDKRGGYSLRKGFDAVTTTRTDATTPTAGYRLFADRDVPCRITEGPQFEVYSQALQRWKALGRAPECSVRLSDIPTSGLTLAGVGGTVDDIEYCNGYLATISRVYTEFATPTGYAFASVVDATTGAVVRRMEQLVAAYSNLCIGSFSSRYFVAFAGAPGTTTITAYILDTSTAATIASGWSLLATVTTGWLADYPISVCSLADRVAVAWVNNSGGGSQVSVATYNAAGSVESTTVNTSAVTPDALDLAGSNADTLWVAWNENAACKVKGLTGTSLTTVLASAATIVTCASAANNIGVSPSTVAGKGRLVVTDSATPVRLHARGFQTTLGAAATDGSQVTIYNAVATGRPFSYGTRHYLPVYSGGISQENTQANHILVDWTDDVTYLRPVANVAPSLAQGSAFWRPKTVTPADSTKRIGVLNVTRSSVATAAALVEYDFANLGRWQAVAHGNSTYLSGGLPSYTDGSRVAEAGFLVRPRKPTTSTSGTGITAATGWRYVCVYEEVDADGNWHVSGLSDPSTSTGAVANKTVTVTTWPLTISGRIGTSAQASSLRVAFYRTTDGGQPPYYRLGTSLNSITSSTVTFADTTTDAILSANAKLYSQPGIVGTSQDHRPPPHFGCLVSYNGMLVGASGSDVWYSAQPVSGEGAWFNPVFQVPVPGDGDIAALAVMDGSLFVFKRREIFAISGEAPSDNGTSGGLGQPRRLAVDVGAISPFTCTTALGVFFQSERGIEILTRAQAVEWIGERVQDTVASYPIVTAMTVDPVSSTVLIELAATEASGLVSGGGRTAVYDLGLRTWVSTDRRKNTAGTADSAAQSACVVYTGSAYRYAWLDIDGKVYTESASSHLDAGLHWVAKRAVSANVKVAGVQGKQHVNKTLLLAKWHTAHDVSMSFAYDYASTYKTARLYTGTQIATLVAALPNEQLEHPMHDDAICEAVRVQLVEATPSTGQAVGTGQGSTWIALAFEVVPHSGAYLLPDESR